ncbi:hypothetical protein Rt10032_c01g0433 [Rhodotorula toruloides]|uniref:Uncharacterized protein n=1 Tax=Rhodotorula toruloides TaxID=5286 RepID=A0A511K8W6_RHOTO|nr:hypothetical protein Rt10032_c01g0433 [Rhodotorula toruloides]
MEKLRGKFDPDPIYLVLCGQTGLGEKEIEKVLEHTRPTADLSGGPAYRAGARLGSATGVEKVFNFGDDAEDSEGGGVSEAALDIDIGRDCFYVEPGDTFTSLETFRLLGPNFSLCLDMQLKKGADPGNELRKFIQLSSLSLRKVTHLFSGAQVDPAGVSGVTISSTTRYRLAHSLQVQPKVLEELSDLEKGGKRSAESESTSSDEDSAKGRRRKKRKTREEKEREDGRQEDAERLAEKKKRRGKKRAEEEKRKKDEKEALDSSDEGEQTTHSLGRVHVHHHHHHHGGDGGGEDEEKHKKHKHHHREHLKRKLHELKDKRKKHRHKHKHHGEDEGPPPNHTNLYLAGAVVIGVIVVAVLAVLYIRSKSPSSGTGTA